MLPECYRGSYPPRGVPDVQTGVLPLGRDCELGVRLLGDQPAGHRHARSITSESPRSQAAVAARRRSAIVSPPVDEPAERSASNRRMRCSWRGKPCAAASASVRATTASDLRMSTIWSRGAAGPRAAYTSRAHPVDAFVPAGHVRGLPVATADCRREVIHRPHRGRAIVAPICRDAGVASAT